jgi:D-aspartate ligase
MNDSATPALIFGSGLTALGVLRSLGRPGLPTYSVCENGDLATKSRWYRPAPEFQKRMPAPSELAAYLDTLWFQKAVLIPCSDHWARAIAELPSNLRARYPASVASAATVDIMTDKWRFAEMIEREDVPRPKTIALHSYNELAALPESSFENRFLKPLDSQKFSRLTGAKAFQLESRRHALAIMADMERQGKNGFPILLQEYIPGPAGSYFLVDGFVDRGGQSLGLIARRRHRMYPAPFGNSTFSETIALNEVKGAVDTLERIWSATKYCGVFDAEFKYDERDGQFKIVEINPRPWWFVEFATRCGVNLCLMSYRHALGLPVEPITTYPAGRCCSYMLYDFAAHRSLEPGLRGFLRWIRSVKGCDEIVYCWDDPGPRSLQCVSRYWAYRCELAGSRFVSAWFKLHCHEQAFL